MFVQILPFGQGTQGEMVGTIVILGFGAVIGVLIGAVIPMAVLAYTRLADMTPTKVKIATNKFDFIEGLFFKFIWIIFPLMFWLGLSDPIELFKVMLFICITFVYFGYSVGRIPYPIFVFKSKLFWVVLIMILVQLVSSIIGDRFNVSFFGLQYRYQGLITQITYILFTLIIVFSKNIHKEYIKFGSLGVALMTIGEFLLFNSERVVGILGNSNFTGGYLALTLPFVGNSLLSGIIFLTIFLTGSRSALVAAVVILVGLNYTKLKNIKAMGVALVLIVLVTLLFPKREISHFDNRFNIWQKGIEAGINKPLFGWGLENFELAFESKLNSNDFDLKNIRIDKAHNEFLEVFVNTGLLGLILYITTIYLTIKNLNNINVKLSFIGFLIIASLNVLSLNEYLFYYLAVGIAIKNQEKIFL